MSRWKLIAADLCLGAAALFGIVLATAPDHPTTTQGVIAWTLFLVLMILALVLLVILVIGVRRIMRRRAGHVE
jgi:type II secretory pathway component PulF